MHFRKWFLKLTLILAAGLLNVGLTGPAYAAQNQYEAAAGQGFLGDNTGNTVTIAYVNWTEAVAVTHLMQALLEKNFDINVKLRLVTPPKAFELVAEGKVAAFLDVWLPETHAKYWQKYKDDVVDLGVWYQGVATLGITVPVYVEAQTIGDLAKHIEDFDGKIVGIQLGSGIMSATKNKVIPAYGLEKYKLTHGSTARMIEAIDRAIRNREEIAFTGWKPHWLFSAYPLRYLEDPKNTLAQSDHLHAIAREGLKEDAPVVYAMLDSFSLNEEQLGSLELAIANARSAWGGVRRWLEKHQKVVAPWISAASPDRTDYL